MEEANEILFICPLCEKRFEGLRKDVLSSICNDLAYDIAAHVRFDHNIILFSFELVVRNPNDWESFVLKAAMQQAFGRLSRAMQTST